MKLARYTATYQLRRNCARAHGGQTHPGNQQQSRERVMRFRNPRTIHRLGTAQFDVPRRVAAGFREECLLGIIKAM